jgi:cytochrome c oxidase subunit II
MKKLLKCVILAVGAVTAGSFSQLAPAQTTPQRIVISAKRFVFTPSEITVKKGQPVVLVLKSSDAEHGLRIRNFNIDMKAKAGGEAEVTFTPDKLGDFEGHCSIFCGAGHGRMVLILHVVE